MVDEKEVDELIKGWEGTEKKLHSSLNAEIRLRKYTLTKIKANCPLFKQRKLTIDQKVRNLKSLISAQLNFKSLADMSDLESAIMNTKSSSSSATASFPTSEAAEEPEPESESESECESELGDLSNWPPKKDDYIYGLFESGILPGRVISATNTEVEAMFLEQHELRSANQGESLWKFPSIERNSRDTIKRHSVLPLHPVMIISRYSTRRLVIYEAINFDLAEKFFF